MRKLRRRHALFPFCAVTRRCLKGPAPAEGRGGAEEAAAFPYRHPYSRPPWQPSGPPWGFLRCLCRSMGQSRAAGEGPAHRGGGIFCRPLHAGVLFCKTAGPLSACRDERRLCGKCSGAGQPGPGTACRCKKHKNFLFARGKGLAGAGLVCYNVYWPNFRKTERGFLRDEKSIRRQNQRRI